ncbi:MAG: metal-sensing transcriptional repressor [Magnetococcales bacterium]|nr:metal-sensing transcriptional repressor [Magnetococcales bacterium]
MLTMNRHACHPEIVARLKRASGHLIKVIAMVEAEAACENVAQQLQAVTNALVAAKRHYVTEHIESCLDIQEGTAVHEIVSHVQALKSMTKYL